MKIALACYEFKNNKIQDNLKKLESGMKLASSKQADLVCFGEAFLQGFDSLNIGCKPSRTQRVRQ